jgi:hypothetical protein
LQPILGPGFRRSGPSFLFFGENWNHSNIHRSLSKRNYEIRVDRRNEVRSIGLKITIIATLTIPALENTAVAGTTSPSSVAFLQSDCQAIWSMAAGDEERLSYDALMYVTDPQGADPDHDGYFTQTEFYRRVPEGSRKRDQGNEKQP